MPRIAVIGNCQALGVAECMRGMLPDSYVKSYLSWEISRWHENDADFIQDLNGFDYVFSHDVELLGTGIKNFLELKNNVPKARLFPIIVFPAFHPDLIYIAVDGQETSFFNSPIGPYSSAISLLAYKLGIDTCGALKLFSEPVYKRLGYFDTWQDSVDALLKCGEEAEFPLGNLLAKWVRSGCFMHSINHAKIYVLADLARALLNDKGVRIQEPNCLGYVQDSAQADAVWPVYPEIAAHMGFSGSQVFRRPNHAGGNVRQYLTLWNFVAESMASYGYFTSKSLRSDRVDGWLADEELCRFISNIAAA
ncbi:MULTISPECIES: WcbI family polysaccharide biosynthesis putative acetyltransferase [unclassified Sphingobium]|uniref:WcbI family polysaccharide biosynthesis putative acetyltransferase n=1 Tax=unclassified Sphingobium TaxID=2611147 RepID=UPI000AB50519|nr:MULTISPECIES: WcbI family polysaccharide biosynthesis putative acetyltransferase [unclassified Sphingobium]